MRQTSILPALLAGTVLLFLADFAHGQVINGGDMAWRVFYHKDNPTPKTGDIALRLKVKQGTGQEDLVGRLTRYDRVMGATNSEKYQMRDGEAGHVRLAGRIVRNQGGSADRKREEFSLVGVYTDTMGKPHEVKVLGFHYTGRTIGERRDDVLCIRVIDHDLTERLGLPIVPAGPCDDEPPDEDVLNEDNDGGGDDPPPDPDYPAP